MGNKKERRVVVTGLGVVSPIGSDVKTFWENLINGVSGIDRIKVNFNPEDYPDLQVKIAGEVKDFNPLQYFDRKEAKRVSRYIQFGVAAAIQAITDSGLDKADIDKSRIGVIIGSGIGGLRDIEEQHEVLKKRGPRRVSPFFIPYGISNMIAGLTAIKFGFKGVNYCVVSACATGTHSIGDAYTLIKDGMIDVAVAGGAGALIVADDVDVGESTPPVIKVDDTLTALGDLAAYRRRLFGDEVTVIGLTGSSGKTTVKEMVAAICRQFYETGDPAPRAVLKTRGNFNNLVGLPLTLLRLGAEHRIAILEMGMNQPGEIARLTEIAGPDIGCINNIQEAHLLGLGTIEGVAAAKGELYRGMDRAGILVVNGDDPLVVGQARRHRGAKIIYAITPAGRRRAPEVRVTRITELGEKGSRITLHVGAWKERFLLPTPGMHNIANAAAAAAIAHAAGIDPESIVAGLAGFTNIDKRMEFSRVPGGLRVVNDSYNANPSSMAAALKTMAGFSSTSRRIAALGDMLELGAGSGVAHRRIGRLAAELGYDLLAVTGEYRQDVVTGARDAGMAKEQVMGFVDTVAMADWLYHLMISGRLGEDDWLLIKGSRGMRMERLLTELQNRFDPSRTGES